MPKTRRTRSAEGGSVSAICEALTRSVIGQGQANRTGDLRPCGKRFYFQRGDETEDLICYGCRRNLEASGRHATRNEGLQTEFIRDFTLYPTDHLKGEKWPVYQRRKRQVRIDRQSRDVIGDSNSSSPEEVDNIEHINDADNGTSSVQALLPVGSLHSYDANVFLEGVNINFTQEFHKISSEFSGPMEEYFPGPQGAPQSNTATLGSGTFDFDEPDTSSSFARHNHECHRPLPLPPETAHVDQNGQWELGIQSNQILEESQHHATAAQENDGATGGYGHRYEGSTLDPPHLDHYATVGSLPYPDPLSGSYGSAYTATVPDGYCNPNHALNRPVHAEDMSAQLGLMNAIGFQSTVTTTSKCDTVDTTSPNEGSHVTSPACPPVSNAYQATGDWTDNTNKFTTKHRTFGKYIRVRKCEASWNQTDTDGNESERRCGKNTMTARDHPDQIDLCDDHGKIASHMTAYWHRHKAEGVPSWVENLIADKIASDNLPSNSQNRRKFKYLYYHHKPKALRIGSKRSKTPPGGGHTRAGPGLTEETDTDEHGMELSGCSAAAQDTLLATDPTITEQEMSCFNRSAVGLTLESSRPSDAATHPYQEPGLFVVNEVDSISGDVHDRQMYAPGDMSNNSSNMHLNARYDGAVPFQQPINPLPQYTPATDCYQSYLPQANTFITVDARSRPDGCTSDFAQRDQFPWVGPNHSQEIAMQMTDSGLSGYRVHDEIPSLYSQDISLQLAQIGPANSSNFPVPQSEEPYSSTQDYMMYSSGDD